MSNDFWRGWWWSTIFHGSNSKPVQPQAGGAAGVGLGCITLMIGWPVLLECVALGGLVFRYVSHPPSFAGEFMSILPSLGLPDFLGWWAAVCVAILYLGAHGFWPLGVALTVFWTPIWVLFGHQFDVRGFNPNRVAETFFTQGWDATAPLLAGQSWTWGIFFGVITLIGHLGLTLGAASVAHDGSPKELVKDVLQAAIWSLILVSIGWVVASIHSGMT